jgi:Tfp pilus assembly protein PilV
MDMRKPMNIKTQSGFSLLEVVIGIFIFVVGIMALASLQGALTRSMADAKVHTVAVNLAEQQIETVQNFTDILSATGVVAYNDIVDTVLTVGPLEGVTYTVQQDITDYYYQLSGDNFTTTAGGAPASDYKVVEILVTWDDDRKFRLDEGSETVGNIKSIDCPVNSTGCTKISAIIPAIVSSASARVATQKTGGDKLAPPSPYAPGARPDIVALVLGDGLGKFKESLTPLPEVIRRFEIVETRFEVITYSSSNGGEFLRREEFAAVSCECTLRGSDSSNLARRPVVWAGDEYAGGQFVQKDYGESANNQQTSLCDTCCRDHHDGGTSTEDHPTDEHYNVFAPFKADGEYTGTARESDHRHYQNDATTLAGAGNRYLEACRLVRVDGFFRVAQDFRREEQYIFPANFLDDVSEVETYSTQITNSVLAHENGTFDAYPSANPPPCVGDNGVTCLNNPTAVGASPEMAPAAMTPISADQLPTWTAFSFVGGNPVAQQLRSRGLYIDYVSNDLRLFLDNCISSGTLVNDCCIRAGVQASQCTSKDFFLDKTGSANVLEILPFFDVQMTNLENWNQAGLTLPLPISLTNEPLAHKNAHSRGLMDQVQVGDTDVTANSHRGNLGFTNTSPIDPVFSDQLKQASLNVQSLDSSGSGGGGGGLTPIIMAGLFSDSVQGNPKYSVSGDGGAFCALAPFGYSCFVAADSSAPSIIVSGYGDEKSPPLDRYACSDSLTRISSTTGLGSTSATFSLVGLDGNLLPTGTTYNIDIRLTDCGGLGG